MSQKLQEQIGALAADAIKLAMASGLSWDEAVAAFGVASKALSAQASTHGHGSKEDNAMHAIKRFNEGMRQDIEVLTSNLH